MGVVDREGIVERGARRVEIAEPKGGRRAQRENVDIVGSQLERRLARPLSLVEIADGEHDLPQAKMALEQGGIQFGHRAEMLECRTDLLLALADLAEFEMRARQFRVQLKRIAQFHPCLDRLAFGQKLHGAVEMTLGAFLGAVAARHEEKGRQTDRCAMSGPPRCASERHPSACREHLLSPTSGKPERPGHVPVASSRKVPVPVPAQRSDSFLHDRPAFYRHNISATPIISWCNCRGRIGTQAKPHCRAITSAISAPQSGETRAKPACAHGLIRHALPSER